MKPSPIQQALELPKGARFVRFALQVNPHAYAEQYRGEQLRGAMDADDFRDTMLFFPFLRVELDHFRGVTKMTPQVIARQNPAAGFYQCFTSQGFLDYSNRRRRRVTEESSVTERSEGQGLFPLRSPGSRQAILDGSNRQTVQVNCRGILGSSIRISRAFSPPVRAIGIPGAMPQAGVTLGLWPSKTDNRAKTLPCPSPV